jgi:hypothetical protein
MSLQFVNIHPTFHIDCGILVRQNKNGTITLHKEQESSLRLSYYFQTEDEIVVHVYTLGHWNYTTLHHYCGEVTQFKASSMPKVRFIDNW